MPRRQLLPATSHQGELEASVPFAPCDPHNQRPLEGEKKGEEETFRKAEHFYLKTYFVLPEKSDEMTGVKVKH